MNGWDWFLLAFVVFGAVMTVGQVDRPRKPITIDQAVAIVLIDVILAIAVVLS